MHSLAKLICLSSQSVVLVGTCHFFHREVCTLETASVPGRKLSLPNVGTLMMFDFPDPVFAMHPI